MHWACDIAVGRGQAGACNSAQALVHTACDPEILVKVRRGFACCRTAGLQVCKCGEVMLHEDLERLAFAWMAGCVPFIHTARIRKQQESLCCASSLLSLFNPLSSLNLCCVNRFFDRTESESYG